MEPLLLRVEEVQKALGLGRSKVYEMMACGELPAVRIGRAVRVPAAELTHWVKARASVDLESTPWAGKTVIQPEPKERGD